jgi:tRNA (cmo5U34)-methyltransferase
MKVTAEQLIESFSFNKFKGEDFEGHIRQSIPNYEGMRRLIPSIVQNFVMKDENIYDLGTSSGDLLLDLHSFFNENLNLSYIGYDIAPNLMPIQKDKAMNFYVRDVTDESLKLFNTSLIFSLFTLQFIPLDKRVKLVQKAYDSLSKRGCFLVCEKVYSAKGITEDIFTFTNYNNKLSNGFSAKDILNKQKDLKTIMKPLTQAENEAMFRKAGFEVVEVFFKSLNFMGWILIK